MRRQLPNAPFERLATLEQRLTDHEARCEERLREIRASVTSTLVAVESLKNRFLTLAVALAAWALSQAWLGSQARLAHLETFRPNPVHDIGSYYERSNPSARSPT